VSYDENDVAGDDSNFLGGSDRDMRRHNVHSKTNVDVDYLSIWSSGLAFCQNYTGWSSRREERHY